MKADVLVVVFDVFLGLITHYFFGYGTGRCMLVYELLKRSSRTPGCQKGLAILILAKGDGDLYNVF